MMGLAEILTDEAGGNSKVAGAKLELSACKLDGNELPTAKPTFSRSGNTMERVAIFYTKCPCRSIIYARNV